MNLKKYKEEIIFIFAVILILASWKIAGALIQMFNDQKSRNNKVTEGIQISEEERKKTENIISETDQILADANQLIAQNALNSSAKTNVTNGFTVEGFITVNTDKTGKLLTSEDYSFQTSENDMTINQRNHSATIYDHQYAHQEPFSSSNNLTDTIINFGNVGKEGLENKNDKKEKTSKEKKVRISSLTDVNMNTLKLRDYYVKSSYNSFNTDDFDYSTISMDACIHVLSRGCRFIDFEIYSIDNVPVIASSSKNDFSSKKSKNSIPVSEAFEVLGNYAFSSAKCPNPEDPFFIHMRIMSENITMYNNLETVIKQSKSLSRRLLPPKYGMDYGVDGTMKDIGDEPLLDFKNKIILIVDSTNPVYKKTNFYKYVNISSNTFFLSKKTFFDVKNIADANQYKEANKKNMALVLPMKAVKPKNEGHNGPYTWGSQFVAMCFQESARDEKLSAYESMFDAVGFAFILKPKDLRYIPITIDPPKPPNPNSSFEGKPAEAPGIGALPPF
jgi:hypothetical protein